MQSLLRRGTSFFGSSTPSTPTPESTANTKPSPETAEVETETKAGGDPLEFRTAPSHDQLFTKVDPAVDGEDCLQDCASCTVKYPARFEVDQEDELYGNVNGWATHLLVATGKTDWVRDVADEAGSVMEAVERGGVAPSNGVCLLPFPFPVLRLIGMSYPFPSGQGCVCDDVMMMKALANRGTYRS